MANQETKDILKAKKLVNEARRTGKIQSARSSSYPLPKGGQKYSFENPWKKEQLKDAKSIESKAKRIKATKIAEAKAKEKARVDAAKKAAKNKMKAQGAKINSSATSNYNRRGKK